jgi:hypothetical protein
MEDGVLAAPLPPAYRGRMGISQLTACSEIPSTSVLLSVAIYPWNGHFVRYDSRKKGGAFYR